MTYTADELLALGEHPRDVERVLSRLNAGAVDIPEPASAGVPVTTDSVPEDKL